MSLPFLKMQALGNDFILVDDLSKSSNLFHTLTEESVKRICHRRLGVGADQILWLRAIESRSEVQAHERGPFDCEMLILNADGTRAETCGNGLRAVGLYLHRYGPTPWRTEYRVLTAAGPAVLKVGFNEVTVDMGIPKVSPKLESIELQGLRSYGLETDKLQYSFRRVDMGNPHAVIFVPDLSKIALRVVGPLIEKSTLFPNRTNVEFVEAISRDHLKTLVWERGAGATLACGSGACAVAAAARFESRTETAVRVSLPGGDLKLEWDGKNTSSILQTGPAIEVFRGELVLN